MDNEWLLENKHALPGAVAAAPVGSVSSASHHDALDVGMCSWCTSAKHCVDKCGKRAAWLAKGQAELHAARESSAKGRKDNSKAGAGAKSSGDRPPKAKRGKQGERKGGQSSKSSEEKVCFDFQKGACTREKCKYKHVKAPAGNSSVAAAAAPSNDMVASAAEVLAVANFLDGATGNASLQKAIRDRIDQGWVRVVSIRTPALLRLF